MFTIEDRYEARTLHIKKRVGFLLKAIRDL